MVCIRFEEVVSRGAGAAVALFSNAVIREMYKTRILAVKVRAHPQGWAWCVASWQGLALAVFTSLTAMSSEMSLRTREHSDI